MIQNTAKIDKFGQENFWQDVWSSNIFLTQINFGYRVKLPIIIFFIWKYYFLWKRGAAIMCSQVESVQKPAHVHQTHFVIRHHVP